MTTFKGGPANGKTLMLKQSPAFLRVTEENGKFDALDAVGDSPRPTEKIHVYALASKDGGAFIDFSGKAKRSSGFYPIATYRYVDQQPPDNLVRDNAAWAAWAAGFPDPTRLDHN